MFGILTVMVNVFYFYSIYIINVIDIALQQVQTADCKYIMKECIKDFIMSLRVHQFEVSL